MVTLIRFKVYLYNKTIIYCMLDHSNIMHILKITLAKTAYLLRINIRRTTIINTMCTNSKYVIKQF